MYLLEDIVVQTGADCAAIMLPHPSKPFLECAENYRLHPDWIAINNPLDNTTVNSRVFTTGKPSLTEHYDKEYVGHFLSSAMVVPIKKNGKVLGNLELIITDQTKSFNRNALNDALDFADLIASDY